MLEVALRALAARLIHARSWKRAPHVKRLGLPHVGYGVKPAGYDTVGTALIDTLEKGLGEAFTPAVRDAWIACCTTIVPEMRASKTKTVKT